MNVSNTREMNNMCKKTRALYMSVRCTLYDIFCGILQLLLCFAPLFVNIIA
jgi:hypothetical protein